MGKYLFLILDFQSIPFIYPQELKNNVIIIGLKIYKLFMKEFRTYKEIMLSCLIKSISPEDVRSIESSSLRFVYFFARMAKSEFELFHVHFSKRWHPVFKEAKVKDSFKYT
jgi:hypothetical protein